MSRKLTDVMVDALEYYGRLGTDPGFCEALIILWKPRAGTRDALIARGLLTAGQRPELTEGGRKALDGQRAAVMGHPAWR